MLSCVGLEITRSFDSISAFLSKTLLHVQREQLSIDVVALAGKAVQVKTGRNLRKTGKMMGKRMNENCNAS